MTFTAQGTTPGMAVFQLGLLGGSTFEDPFGFTLYGTKGSGVVLGVAPTGKPVTLDVPHGSTTVGTAFGVQALVRPVTLASTSTGSSAPAPQDEAAAGTTWTAGLLSEIGARFGGAAPAMDRRRARDLSHHSWTCDIEETRRALRWRPEVGIEEGLSSTADWYREVGWL